MKYHFRAGCLLECPSPSPDNRLLLDACFQGTEEDPIVSIAMRVPDAGGWLSLRDTLLTHTITGPIHHTEFDK